ncbi:FtsX-like permease family protein [Leifsonia sp. YAF41]|uniref:ABC transporter permease n=1 Tax=Leifsonia sp. YAF41 TaxID=3233086 RepID=UPI003F9DFE66
MSAHLKSRDHRASVLVAALSAAFGVLLIQVTGALTAMIGGEDVAQYATVRIVLVIVAFVFIVIAVYVGSIVTVNTVATVIAGRVRTIALMRLIGSSARSERRRVAGEGFRSGLVGAVIGGLLGLGVAFAVVQIAVANSVIPPGDYPPFDPLSAVPVAIVIVATGVASWVGSRRVLTVSPMQAIGAATERSTDEGRQNRGRTASAITLMATGTLLLLAGVALGLVSPLGVLVGLVGGLLSFTGLMLGAHLVMPPILALAGRLLGSSAPATLAAANARRYPERSSRNTIGLVIGVTLITMFAVAGQSYQDMMTRAQAARPELYGGVDQIVTVTVAIFSVLIGFSALIAAVGMVNNLALGVLQRTRELGLLRALGFTAGQVRRMILAESLQMTIAAVGFGLVLGTFYGWAGAVALLGAQEGVGLIAPSIPWPLLVGCVVGAALLTLGASLSPVRRATSVSPMVALAAE